MAHTVQPAGVLEGLRRDAMTVVALVALACTVGSVAGPSLLGAEMPYTGGAALVVGIGAVVCGWLRSRAARTAVACVTAGLVLIRVASAALPEVFVRSHGAPSLADSAGMLVLLAAAVTMLAVGSIRR